MATTNKWTPAPENRRNLEVRPAPEEEEGVVVVIMATTNKWTRTPSKRRTSVPSLTPPPLNTNTTTRTSSTLPRRSSIQSSPLSRKSTEPLPTPSISPNAENISRAYALVAHRARRLAVTHRHADGNAVVACYQELVIDCYAFLGMIEELGLGDGQGGMGGHGGQSGSGDGSVADQSSSANGTVKRLAPSQLALLQAVNRAREALNKLAATVRHLPAPTEETTGSASPQQSPTTPTSTRSDTTMGTFDRDLSILTESITSCLNVTHIYLQSHHPTHPPHHPHTATHRKFSTPITDPEKLAATFNLRRCGSVPTLPTNPHTTVSALPTVLAELTTVLTASRQELRLLNPSIDAQFHQDLSIVQQAYTNALETLAPLSTSFAAVWERVTVANAEMVRKLKMGILEGERRVREVEGRVRSLEGVNVGLMEDNVRLRKELDSLRGGRCTCGGSSPSSENPYPTPDTDTSLSLSTSPLPHQPIDTSLSLDIVSPASELDEFLSTELDYSTIVKSDLDGGSGAEAVVIYRLTKSVESVEKVLRDVEGMMEGARARYDVGSVDGEGGGVRRGRKSLTLPVCRVQPLWKDFLSVDPRSKAATKIQSHYRRHLARRLLINAKKRKLIALELLQTEISYVKTLLSLQKDFMLPIRKEMMRDSSLMTAAEFDIIFRYLVELAGFHKGFLRGVCER
ncbi:hypothetical protein HDV00_011399, partial [Rhizophlyctis rosea]